MSDVLRRGETYPPMDLWPWPKQQGDDMSDIEEAFRVGLEARLRSLEGLVSSVHGQLGEAQARIEELEERLNHCEVKLDMPGAIDPESEAAWAEREKRAKEHSIPGNPIEAAAHKAASTEREARCEPEHDWGPWLLSVSGAGLMDGSSERECIRCGEVAVRPRDPLGLVDTMTAIAADPEPLPQSPSGDCPGISTLDGPMPHLWTDWVKLDYGWQCACLRCGQTLHSVKAPAVPGAEAAR